VAISKNESAKIVQFSCRGSVLHRLAEDVRCSSFASRPKYIAALLETLLSIDPAVESSCLDELIGLLGLFESLPLARIRRLAVLQNRNFDQMFRHLIDVALSYYPEDVLKVDAPHMLSHSKLQTENNLSVKK
jgi:hypothetical protein